MLQLKEETLPIIHDSHGLWVQNVGSNPAWANYLAFFFF